MEPFIIRSLVPADRGWVRQRTVEAWGADIVVVHGAIYRPAELPGFTAEAGSESVGLLTYHVERDACEVVTLEAFREGLGVGTALLAAARGAAMQAGCRRLWLVTTNDNTHALRFYQKRGFVLAALRADAVRHSRALKPEIPSTGNDGIPIRDEIELEMRW